jgi:hypothetical protein
MFSLTALQEMDAMERKSVRSFFNLNLPNTFLMSELKVSMAQWRQNVVYLASFLRMLGADPPNIRVMAMMMTRDAEPRRLAPGRMNPPFFDWHVVLPATPPPYCLHNIPVIVACLARDAKVGLTEVNGRVRVSYKGTPVDNPRGMLRTLSKTKEKELLKLLEDRQSTDLAKEICPLNSVSWGMAGRFNRLRKMWRDRVMGPGSLYSDSEVRILLGLQLCLWDTEMRKSVYSNRAVEGTCYCGARCQTAEHLLNLPPGNAAHSEWLRSVRNVRHSELTAEVAATVGHNWSVIEAEHLPRDLTGAIPMAVREAIGEAAALRQLHMDGDTEMQQHCKPDGILWCPAERTVYIYDVTTTSDHHLWVEEAFWIHMKEYGMTEWKMAHTPGMFDRNGALQELGMGMVKPEDVKFTGRILSFTRVRYLLRYAKLAAVIKAALVARHVYRPDVRILTLAVGTGGYIPRATESALKTLCKGRATHEKLCKDLMDISHRMAIKVFGAWRAEQEAHYAAEALAHKEAQEG